MHEASELGTRFPPGLAKRLVRSATKKKPWKLHGPPSGVLFASVWPRLHGQRASLLELEETRPGRAFAVRRCSQFSTLGPGVRAGRAGPAQWGEECVERLHGRRVDIDALLQAERHRVQAKTKEGHSRGGADGATGFRTSRRSWRLNSAGAQRPPTLLGQQRLALPCSGCCKEQVKELQRTLKDPYRNPRLRFSA